MTFAFLFLLVYASYVHHAHFAIGWWILAWIVALLVSHSMYGFVTRRMNDMSTCATCGKDTENYTLTDGDPYGDAKYVGIKVGKMLPYCEDCVILGNYPNLDDEIDNAYAERGWCGFLEAWVGRCREHKPCIKHESQRCWKCGNPAIRNCSEAGSLVCGMPECARHPHEHK